LIIADWKPLPELLAFLRGHKRVLLAGCATCMAECATGGQREVETLAPLLRLGSAQAGEPVEIVTYTAERQCEWEFVEQMSEVVSGVDAVLSIACGIGIQAVAERYADVPVYPGVNTTSLAMRSEPGLWETRCAACGDCVLGETFGLCPVARCAKSIQNGPCGGTRSDGQCEIQQDTPCVWLLIWERATRRGGLERLTELRPAKDWSGSNHFGPVRMVKKDHRP
jgi:ferredoxin